MILIVNSALKLVSTNQTTKKDRISWFNSHCNFKDFSRSKFSPQSRRCSCTYGSNIGTRRCHTFAMRKHTRQPYAIGELLYTQVIQYKFKSPKRFFSQAFMPLKTVRNDYFCINLNWTSNEIGLSFIYSLYQLTTGTRDIYSYFHGLKQSLVADINPALIINFHYFYL